MVSGSPWFVELGDTLYENFGGDKGYPNCAHGEVSYCVMWMASWFVADAALILPWWGKEMDFDCSISREKLGIQYRPQEETLKDMVHAMIHTGYVPPPEKK